MFVKFFPWESSRFFIVAMFEGACTSVTTGLLNPPPAFFLDASFHRGLPRTFAGFVEMPNWLKRGSPILGAIVTAGFW